MEYFSGCRSRRSVRSGYAFSHSEGFGRLITSGRIMREGGPGGTARPAGKQGNGLLPHRSVTGNFKNQVENRILLFMVFF